MSVGDELRVGPVRALRAGARSRGRHRHTVRVYTPRRALEFRLGRLWAYRGTIPVFGRTLVRRRFVGTWLGYLWIPLRPTLGMLSKGLFFGGMLHVGSGTRPYLIFLMVGQASWDFFDRAVYWGYRGIRSQRKVLQLLPVPWTAALGGSILLAVADAMPFVGIAFIAAVYYKFAQGSFYITLQFPQGLVRLCLGSLLLVGWAFATSLIVSPLIVKVRDLRFIVRYMIGFWYFLTPVLYAVSALPAKYQGLAVYNPLTAPIEYIKDALLGTGPPESVSILVSAVGVAVLLPIGLLFCSYMERQSHASL